MKSIEVEYLVHTAALAPKDAIRYQQIVVHSHEIGGRQQLKASRNRFMKVNLRDIGRSRTIVSS